jgi:hypothetical protein
VANIFDVLLGLSVPVRAYLHELALPNSLRVICRLRGPHYGVYQDCHNLDFIAMTARLLSRANGCAVR